MRRPSLSVLIDGVETPCRAVQTRHGTDQPTAAGSVTMRAPRPVHVQPGATCVVYAGYDGDTRKLFDGRLADDEAKFDENGGELRVTLEGWSKILSYKNNTEVGFTGPMSLNVWWRSLCNWRQVPFYRADDTRDHLGNLILLGNNPVKGAWIPIRTDRSPLADMTRQAELYGFRHFDTPSGVVRLQKVSGYPTEWETPENLDTHFIEGINIMRVERAQSYSNVYNVIDVKGAKYEDATTGEPFAIRAFTGTYDPHPLLGPDGLNTREIQDDSIDTQALADAVRTAYEVDYGGVQHRYRWTCVGGDATHEPGEEIAVTSGTVAGPDGDSIIDTIVRFLPHALWLTRIDQSITDAAWTTTMEGWAGLGQVMPAGVDCVEQTILAGSVHVGNEYLEHYRNSAAVGLEYEIAFTIPDDYTTATILCDLHGANSFVQNQASTASKFEIWQGSGEDAERKMSGEMPRQNENLEQRLDYDLDANWTASVIPLSGSVEAGPARLKLISGLDSEVGDHDDFEAKRIRVRFCGVGVPTPIGGI